MNMLPILAGGLLLFLLLVFIISILAKMEEKDNKQEKQDDTIKEDKILQDNMSLKEYQKTLKWMLQMGIIDTSQYTQFFNKGLQFVKR